MSAVATGTVSLHTGYDGELEEHPIVAQDVAVPDGTFDDMHARRRAAGVSLADANRARAAHGLPPLGKIEQDRRQTVYRVPSWGR